MSDSDRVGVAYVVESEYGEFPSGPAETLQNLRLTSETFQQNTDTVQSTEIRSDRQVTDVIRTDVGASGDLNFELSYGTYDDFLEAALQGTWSSNVTSMETTYAAVQSGNIITDSGDAFVSDGFLINQWIKVSGFTTAINNGFFKITAIAVGSITVQGATLEDEVAGDSVTITMAPYIENGVTSRSFSLERVYTDIANEFVKYTGMVVDTLTLDFSLQAIATGAIGFIGQDEESAAATSGDGTNDAVTTTEVVNTIDNIPFIQEAAADFSATGLSIALSNNLRRRPQLGTLGPISIGAGKCQVTGSLAAYFADATVIDKYLNATESSLAFRVTDDSDNSYIIEIPQLKYGDGKRPAPGENQDVMLEVDFIAYRDPTELVTIRIAKFPGS